MTLEELYDKEVITTRTYNACKSEGFANSEDIIQYLNKHGSFHKLRRCGEKSYRELNEVCDRYNKNNESSAIPVDNMNNDENKTSNYLLKTVQDIYKDNEISVRSYNVCYYNDLLTTEDIVRYYQKNGGLFNLRNCGLKTRIELEVIYQKAFPFFQQPFQALTGEDLITKRLSRTKVDIALNILKFEVTDLSVRTRNSLMRHLDGDISLKNFETNILLIDNPKLIQLHNLGKKSWGELTNFKERIRNLLSELLAVENEAELIGISNEYYLKTKFPEISVPENVKNSSSIFLILDHVIKFPAFQNEREAFILKHCLKIFESTEKLTLTEAANILFISRERVRQIRQTILDDLAKKFEFVKNIYDLDVVRYKENLDEDFLFISDEIANTVNKRANSEFTKEFILYIIYLNLDSRYKVVGDVTAVLTINEVKRRTSYNWKNIYLLEINLAKKFQAEKFIEDLEKRLNERLDESYALVFKSYISSFVSEFDLVTLERILPFAEFILNKEFNLFLDVDERIIFTRNTIRQVHEYAYEALEEIGGPAKVEEIYKVVKERYPHFETSETGLRASMKRKNGFVAMSRTSTYGLKVWEKELTDFKGGTIRSIITEFLISHDIPQRISDITEYVLKFRPKTNEKSILNNLKVDESDTFVFYKNSMVGLKGKEYPDSYEKLDEISMIDRNSWESRYQDLQTFIRNENRFPLSNNVPIEEIKLYRWLNVQKSKIKASRLNAEKAALINAIFVRYPHINASRYLNSMSRYPELEKFITVNNRLPRAGNKDEERLYAFFRNQRKLNSENLLHDIEKNKFEEIIKMLQTLQI
ncbi:hypothetical protein EGI11_03495 [Chryseobacterium sp. H3056]|uniref:Uncharacterized protein n=1 Tax=Kaistella daneshvariae TaxID=2487074 RepID=A0A3N0WXX4_9FLAO|nr:helicase associated domain-containing protein [Kaistella daneshvariae]ROI09833.1 hypothetical protein EGI11_03495 [Kaistella daneshvariae]